MKKTLILISFIFLNLNSFSQKKINFKPGVKIVKKEIVENYKKPSSILFVFEGHTHLINYYKDLSWRIQKIFKKKLKENYKNFKLDFNYNLSAGKPYESDLKNIPSKKYKPENYETVCYINQKNFKGWDNHLLRNRKQNYDINVELLNHKQKELMKLKMNVNSYYITITQNKNSSKKIFQAIME